MKIFNLNRHVITGTGILLTIYLLSAAPTLADYSITWYTIDCGGGTGNGGKFSITGTIGQPDSDWAQQP
jgi:hypothetical protein